MTAQASRYDEMERATSALDAPFAVVDLDAFRANADDLVRRAAGKPVRVATKSVRCRHLVGVALGTPGFRGVMAYSLREALWLAGQGVGDILVAYPSVDREAIRTLRADPVALDGVTVMVDDAAHLELLTRHRPREQADAPVRVCLDVDASLRLGPLHLGVRRSPLRTPSQVRRLAEHVVRHRSLRLVGLMFYEAQVAGLPDSSAPVRWVKRRSSLELLDRRAEVVDAVRPLAELELVNGGGTGSLHLGARDPSLTELSAGSGLFGPTLFDGYDAFRPRPAAFFTTPVVRRPAPGMATTFGGGWVASGPAGRSRLPAPWRPRGLRLTRTEGVGEVQTPLTGPTAGDLHVGDRVWWRHAKAGELCEHVRELHLVEGDRVVASVPTYRGEGKAFG
jgi:D-serine deaminase-like pyridoxal phosphate-dependent protein